MQTSFESCSSGRRPPGRRTLCFPLTEEAPTRRRRVPGMLRPVHSRWHYRHGTFSVLSRCRLSLCDVVMLGAQDSSRSHRLYLRITFKPRMDVFNEQKGISSYTTYGILGFSYIFVFGSYIQPARSCFPHLLLSH